MFILFQPKQKADPLFGLMKFRRTFSFIGAGFWEGEANFAPLGKHVKIYVTAGRSGVSETQREFYRELEKRYVGLIEAICDVVVDTPLNYWGVDFFGKIMPELNWQDYELDSIFIPSPKTPEAEWGLSYRYLPMDDTYTVYFEGWKPSYGKLDD